MRLYEIATPSPGQKITVDTGLEFYSQELKELHSRLAVLRSKISGDNLADIKNTKEKISNVNQSIKELQDRYKNIPQIKKIWQEIQSSCSDAISDMISGEKLLYRGLKNTTSPAFHAYSTQNRIPKDSNVFLSEVFDYALTELGVQALRKNSIFVSADRHQSQGYGNLYMIFPINNEFSFTWTDTKDIVIDRDDADEFIDHNKLENLKKEIRKAIETESNLLQKFPDRSTSIINTLSGLENISADELFFYLGADSDFLVDLGKSDYELDFDWRHYVNINAFKARYEPKTSDLVTAIESGHEIWISGRYYALSVTFFEDFVLKSLDIPPPKLSIY